MRLFSNLSPSPFKERDKKKSLREAKPILDSRWVGDDAALEQDAARVVGWEKIRKNKSLLS